MLKWGQKKNSLSFSNEMNVEINESSFYFIQMSDICWFASSQ